MFTEIQTGKLRDLQELLLATNKYLCNYDNNEE